MNVVLRGNATRILWQCLPALALPILLGGCATPPGRTTATTVIAPDADDNVGGSFIESSDIRTVAGQMAAAILAVPEVADCEDVLRIAVAPVRNSTRYVFDKEIFTKRLRLELNKVAEGRVRFLSQGVGQEVRSTILAEQSEDKWDRLLADAARALVAAPAIAESQEPVKVALMPVKNTNLAGVNAESFTALLRAKIAEEGKGKVVFLAREASGKVAEPILDEKDLKDQGLVSGKNAKQLHGVDYFLSGEFIAKSLMTESAQQVTERTTGRSPDDPGVLQTDVKQGQVSPNVTKYLNVKLISADTGATPFEKLVRVEDKVSSGLGRAALILTGEISALSKAGAGGDRSDYVMMSFQLVDPATNEIVWEDAYETKKKTRVSVIYK
jgi:PBP1b-binding outer membrane lipoprotein LpoB